MPELPEVETIRAALDPLLSGRTITAAEAHPSPKFAPATRAAGRTVTGVRRRGKYLLADLAPTDEAGPGELVVHLGMTGQLRPDLAPDPYVRARWHLDDGSTLVYRDIRRFGRIAVVDAGDHRSLPTLAALGPEPFGDDFTPESLRAALARSRARVKTQLLGQRVVAGVGNIYADEALWQAGIAPTARRVGAAARRPPPRRGAGCAGLGAGARRHDPARLPHPERRVGHQPGPAGLLRPGRSALPAVRDAAAALGGRCPGHDQLPDLPALTPRDVDASGPPTSPARTLRARGSARATTGSAGPRRRRWSPCR